MSETMAEGEVHAWLEAEHPGGPGVDIGITNLSCYSMGLMGYRAPNIDRIAADGMQFTNSYGEQSCTPGRSPSLPASACTTPV